MKDLTARLFKLFGGTIGASFCIASILHSNLGAFATTACNISFSNWFPFLTVGMVGFLIELMIMLILIYLKEGIGLAGIVNMTIGSICIDIFNTILPYSPLMVLTLPLLGVFWCWVAQSEFGETNLNLLTTAIMKKTGKSISVIRTIQECSFLAIGLLNSNCVTWFTIVLSLFLGKMLGIIYKMMKFNPTEIEHKYIIRAKTVGGGQYEISKKM